MNNELINVFHSILKEELEPIHKRLDAIEQTGNKHTKRFDTIEKDIKDLKTGQETFQKNIIKSLGDNIEKIAEPKH
jgi:chaperonin cofactor prefoldin